MHKDNKYLRSTWQAGLIITAVGLFIVALYLGLIEVNQVSRRRPVFDDPSQWQIAAFGLMFIFAGISLVIPQHAEALGRFNAMLFIITVLAAGSGTIWFSSGGSSRQKAGSMDAYLDSLAAWFYSFGVHPILGAFALGGLIAFVFAYRKNSEPKAFTGELPGRADGSTQSSGFAIGQGKSVKISYSVNGQPMDLDPEIYDHLRKGNKLEAIKALRLSTGMGLKESKDIIDTISGTQ